jgi:sRNA-binding carbon storage regulator CsrA
MSVRQPIIHLVLSCLLVISMAGCMPIVLVSVGAVGGYAIISQDTIEGPSSRGQDEIWDAASHVLGIMGEVTNSDRKTGTIKAKVSGDQVTVTVIPVSLTATKLRIKARKSIFPRIVTAQDVYTKIMHQLEQ